MQRANVPCGSCHLCCKSEVLALMPDEGDKVETYEHEYITLPMGRVPVLKHKPNGDCVYLGPEGCTIHDRAPVICRIFDCRRWFLAHSRPERRRMIADSLATKAVFAAGRARLASLAPTECEKK
jgi:Fe-S-cluster containining protein